MNFIKGMAFGTGHYLFRGEGKKEWELKAMSDWLEGERGGGGGEG